MTHSAVVPLYSRKTVNLSAPLERFALVSAILILFTSSFDIALVINVGGTYRFCQMIAVLLIFLSVVKAAKGARTPVLGAAPLIVWLAFQIAFIPATDFWPKSLGYCFWLLLDLALVFSYVQLFSYTAKTLVMLVRWYAWSFAAIAGFGIVQFLLPIAGLGAPFIEQWWIPNQLARVNGFSYEPSYLATYLLIGFVFVGSLKRSRSALLPAKWLRAVYWLTGTGIILSSSRMGIVFLLLDVLLSQLTPWASFLSDMVKGRIVIYRLHALIPSFLSIAFIGAVLGTMSITVERNPSLALLFLNGTGISNTAAHSVIQREGALEETVTVFLQNPVIGRSLGGVSSAIAGLQGVRIHSFEESKQFEGMSVFAEALAASGLFGIVPFAWFLTTTIRKPLRAARAASPFYSSLLYALVRSLVFAWMILQFNQNMLRPYLWTHIAILATVYAAALQSTTRSTEACKPA